MFGPFCGPSRIQRTDQCIEYWIFVGPAQPGRLLSRTTWFGMCICMTFVTLGHVPLPSMSNTKVPLRFQRPCKSQQPGFSKSADQMSALIPLWTISTSSMTYLLYVDCQIRLTILTICNSENISLACPSLQSRHC